MKKLFLAAFLVASLSSCNNNKKLEEVVEVPLPEKEEVVTEMGNPADVKVDEGGAFEMIALPYAYNALEPHIDAKTMEVHFSKHHLGYANNLNKAIVGTEMANMSIEDILKKLDPENKAVRNNGGGYYNHNFFWEIMAPNKGGEPTGAVAEAITKDFGSFADFKTQFTEAATKQFGSGWAWLIVDKTGKLVITTTANQDNPLMTKLGNTGTPILAVDVWEHAYYLKHQNKRKDYVEGFFNVINWDKVTEKYTAAVAVE
ncbi:superoxide dismutase [Flavobacterium piscinae]|uniref:Superoxide dismutase n=1 Tax=Flavobacterium piscinae TaxID=2506424 RepID=A0A4Q1KL10_9FLAO|nr:superoxide dismutase [Flavobacterium piscinae]